ncbi:conserved protein of unknown function [Rhodovastum atsumiense]|uniref:Phage late control D family protein n=1 Tax=Rhodovastum atsumiense TaxID=504468 RepID=A0A5M6IZS5_9PROT|nr:hypothetical protein [Rhodovastum atsumiense]KAA5613479.1 hypothetical protein F1189_05330 [Rhodovastum atsumiense]CAH2603221.1 conserved protein of unknown function [Rhodovastum atsumiense]
MSGILVIPAPDVRAPRIAMRVNGQFVPGLLRFSVASNNYWSADLFSAHLASSALPRGHGPAYWADTDAIDLELLAWLEGRTQPATIIRGLVDQVAVGLEQGTIVLRGRDYASLLIDTRTSEKFPNQTLSQIAHMLAERRGLEADVTETTVKAGDYYKGEHVQMSDAVSEWTLLTWLVEREGLDVWVSDRTLHVREPPAVELPPLGILYNPADAVEGTMRANAPVIALERNLTLARDIQVTVRSWNHEQKAAITVTRRGTRIRRPVERMRSQNLPPHSYVFTVPGLTRVQAEQLAEKKLAELSRHERTLLLQGLPAVPGLTVRRRLRLSGTGTAFDQDYFIVEMDREFSFDCGSRMSLRCKNSSPRNQVTL